MPLSFNTNRLICTMSVILMFIVFGSYDNILIAQNKGIDATSMVDLFSGDLNYNIPISSLPTPQGNSFDLNASYSGGIKNNQQSSILGLGWSINVGEIVRFKNGLPDDYNGSGFQTETFETIQGTSVDIEVKNYYGPMYFSNYIPSSNNNIMDISHEFLNSSAAYYPNYDDFYVSAQGIGGELLLLNKDLSANNSSPPIGSLSLEDQGDIDYYDYVNNPAHSDQFSDDVGFYYKDYSIKKHVQYFTNSEINGYDPSSSPSLGLKGFLDYRVVSGQRRDPSLFPEDGIGAFTITSEAGLRYHFSLPVYVRKDKSLSVPFKHDGSLKSDDESKIYELQEDYAFSWKLTAITGPNYQDANNNGIADEGDSGYWLSASYLKHQENFDVSMPTYGLNMANNSAEIKIPTAQKTEREAYQMERIGTSAYQELEIYYPIEVRSESHSMFLFYSDRMDGNNINRTANLLKLNDVIVVSNQDAGNLHIDASNISNGSFTGLNSFVNNSNLDFLFNSLDILKRTKLVQDYSLAKDYILNSQTSVSTFNSIIPASNNDIDFNSVSKNVTSNSGGTSSGKLTLKEIEYYGRGNIKAMSPLKLDYDYNPDFEFEKYDYFGYYKSNKNSTNERYTTSAIDVAAWSLTRITTPEGAEISIEYESDNYVKALNHAWQPRIVRLFVKDQDNGDFLDSDAALFASSANLISSQVWEYPSNVSNVSELASLNGFSQLFLDYAIGGGIRVKNISIHDNISNASYITNFGYKNGVLTKPVGEFIGDVSSGELMPLSIRTRLDAPMSKVGYEYVEITNIGDNGHSNGTSIHKFDVSNTTNFITNRNVVSSFDGPYDSQFNTQEERLPYPAEISQDLKIELNSKFGLLERKEVYNSSNKKVEEFIYSYSYPPYNPTLNLTQKFDYAYSVPFDIQTHEILIPPVFICEDATGLSWSGSPGQALFPNDFFLLNGNDNYSKTSITKILDWKYGYDGQNVGEYVPIYPDIPFGPGLNYGDQRFLSLIEYNTLMVAEGLQSGCSVEVPPASYLAGYPMGKSTEYLYDITKSYRIPTLHKVRHFKDGIWSTKNILKEDTYSLTPNKVQTVDGTGLDQSIVTTFEHQSKLTNILEPNLIDIPITKEVFSYGQLVAKQKFNWSETANVREVDAIPLTQLTNIASYLQSKDDYDTENDSYISTYEVTLLNQKLKPLEERQSIDYFSSTIYGYNNLYPIASVKNANYLECAYTSFEDELNSDGYFASEVYTTCGLIDNSIAGFGAHTGEKMVSLSNSPSDKLGFKSSIGTDKLRLDEYYRFSVWLRKSELIDFTNVLLIGTVNVASSQSSISLPTDNIYLVEAGDWIQLKTDIYIDPNIGITANDEIFFEVANLNTDPVVVDDFRIHPVDAQMISAVLDAKTGWTLFELDSENYYTRFEYDHLGNIIKVFKETESGEILIQENLYNYAD